MTLPKAWTNTTIDVPQSTPIEHCRHDDGAWAIQVVGHPSIVYLHGTPDQIIDWATKVRSVAIDLLRKESTE